MWDGETQVESPRSRGHFTQQKKSEEWLTASSDVIEAPGTKFSSLIEQSQRLKRKEREIQEL